MSALFESFNARWISAEQVAKTFILRQSEFAKLSGVKNSLVIGPRGSGKTTLLKMLTITGLREWAKISDSSIPGDVSYVSVFLGADRQFDLFVKGLDGKKAKSDAFLASVSKTLVSLRLKNSLLDSLMEITDNRILNEAKFSNLHIKIDQYAEVEICKFLSRSWNIADQAYTFSELRATSHAMIAKLNRIIDQYRFLAAEDKDFRISDAYKKILDAAFDVSEDPFQTIYAFIDAVENTTSVKRKWCLCVDELEILPDFLQTYFFQYLRSTDHRLILKIATSPFSASIWGNSSADSPMPDNDYQVVNLSFPNKAAAVDFSKQIFAAIAGEAGANTARPEDILGTSPLSIVEEFDDENASTERYKSPDGVNYKRFKQLAEIDKEFEGFLERRHINLEKLDQLSESARAAVRKHIWQVAIRLDRGRNQVYSSGPGGVPNQRRSSPKRISDLYLGAESIFTICEGNPRNTIGVVRPLIKSYVDSGFKTVPYSQQSDIILQTIAKYLSLLSVIPLGSRLSAYGKTSVVKFIDEIGDFFVKRNLGQTYPTEYANTIKVDRVITQDILDAVGAAMNQGAFVMISDATRLHEFGSLDGARLRLSYLLAPRYHLALTYSGEISLSRIIRNASSLTSNSLKMRDLFEHGG